MNTTRSFIEYFLLVPYKFAFFEAVNIRKIIKLLILLMHFFIKQYLKKINVQILFNCLSICEKGT